MSNPFANEDVMEDYLGALLTEEPIAQDVQLQTVAKLLDEVKPTLPPPAEVEELLPLNVEPKSPKVLNEQVEKDVEPLEVAATPAISQIPANEFQALLFEIAGLTLAVPLTELGGIHEIEKISPLIGKPSWFKGVMLHRDEKFNVVDTAMWVMPEKNAEKLAESVKYQYLIVLDNSGWGLASESLTTTITLQPEDVKWRSVEGKRPWLAGMVKKKMCALINVQQIVNMLNQGMNSSEQ
jgi:purine-binding chemotaxis protein CheW